MATAHLIHGYLGAGKTTFARRLERDLPALRFSPDEWMGRLYGIDPPAENFALRAQNIAAVMESVWTRALALGVDVVLDFGFWQRAERDRVRALAGFAGATSQLYAMTCPEVEARRRVSRRNRAPGGSLFIAPETFDALKARFEPLAADEEIFVNIS